MSIWPRVTPDISMLQNWQKPQGSDCSRQRKYTKRFWYPLRYHRNNARVYLKLPARLYCATFTRKLGPFRSVQDVGFYNSSSDLNKDARDFSGGALSRRHRCKSPQEQHRVTGTAAATGDQKYYLKGSVALARSRVPKPTTSSSPSGE